MPAELLDMDDDGGPAKRLRPDEDTKPGLPKKVKQTSISSFFGGGGGSDAGQAAAPKQKRIENFFQKRGAPAAKDAAAERDSGSGSAAPAAAPAPVPAPAPQPVEAPAVLPEASPAVRPGAQEAEAEAERDGAEPCGVALGDTGEGERGEAVAEAEVQGVEDAGTAAEASEEGEGEAALRDDSDEEASDAEEVAEEEDEEAEAEAEAEGKAAARKAPSKRAAPRAKGAAKAKQAAGVGDGLLALSGRVRDYDPAAAAIWQPGEPVPFLFVARAFDKISAESKRLSMQETLCNCLRTVMATSPADLLHVVYLAANEVAPPHEGVVLGVGDAMLLKMVAEATGRKEAQIRAELKEVGDLGLVASRSRTTQRTMFAPQPLTCAKVLDSFRFIAKEAGKDSGDKKRSRMKQLLVAARESEPQYIVRLLQGKMRIGLAAQTVLAALGQAAVLMEEPQPPQKELPARLEEAVRILKQVFSVLPMYDRIVPALLDVGVRRLPEVCRFTLGVPVEPMRAKPTRGVSEILDKFQDCLFTCEYKYDGERAQIHAFEDGRVEIYSRNCERQTQRYPDVAATITKHAAASVKSFVMDCEVVAYDKEKGHILSFQALSTRARKGVQLSEIKVQVCVFAFDLLFLNGEDLLQRPLIQRRELLHSSFTEAPGDFVFATSITTRDVEEIQAFLKEAVTSNCEGLMLKTLETDATYEAAKRSNKWLKLKKDYIDNVGDSLDLVPIGAFHGRGKRAGVFGAFLLACYDEETEEFQSICKIGTGFSEQMLEERSTSLRELLIDAPRPYYRFGETLGVDVWFEPAEVWEVKAADLSISPVHCASRGHVDANKGIGLRFPRFIRVREDKPPEQATSAEQVAEMYRAQKVNHHAGAAEDDD